MLVNIFLQVSQTASLVKLYCLGSVNKKKNKCYFWIVASILLNNYVIYTTRLINN